MSPATALDVDLFASLKQAIENVNDVEVIQSMMVVDSNEYRRFITNEVENPHFRIKKSVFDIDAAAAVIDRCEAEVAASTANEVVLQLYRAKLKNQRLRFQLLDAAARNDDETFTTLSQDLYGRPRREYFSMLVHHTLDQTPASKEAERALDVVHTALSHVAKPTETLPTDVLPASVSDTSPALSAQAVATVFTQTLTYHELDNWSVEVDTSNRRQRFAVNPYNRTVYVPGDEQLAARSYPLTATAAEALAAHEIGVHAVRAEAGYQSSLQLLGLGLDGYLAGEEGLASYTQQQIEGATHFYGHDRYVAIALALGLDGEKRDFRSVFSLLQAYYLVHDRTTEPDPDIAIKHAWSVCQRIFRGTTGQTVGTVFTRDLAYFEGNFAIWEYITQHPERYEDLFIGKFNPLNERHVASLQTLELLPQW